MRGNNKDKMSTPVVTSLSKFVEEVQFSHHRLYPDFTLTDVSGSRIVLCYVTVLCHRETSFSFKRWRTYTRTIKYIRKLSSNWFRTSEFVRDLMKRNSRITST